MPKLGFSSCSPSIFGHSDHYHCCKPLFFKGVKDMWQRFSLGVGTLFLLSYAKLFHIIITIFSSIPVVYPNGYYKTVWLYDGNVKYLKGEHIPLFIAALLILILLSIPFTLSLLCIQWLQRLSHLKLLNWVNTIQPLFDAFTGPNKLKHRYWPGLLLLLRVCLYIAFSCNVLGDPKINLIVITIVLSIMLLYCTMVGGVYKS